MLLFRTYYKLLVTFHFVIITNLFLYAFTQARQLAELLNVLSYVAFNVFGVYHIFEALLSHYAL